jgi:hypothetical protein
VKTVTPAEQYAKGRPVLENGRAAMLDREESAEAELLRGVDTMEQALTNMAAAYIDRIEKTRAEREAYAEAAQSMTALANSLGLDDVYEVPASRVPTTGLVGAVYRAAERGTAAVVFELASRVAARAAKEM